MYAHLHTVNLRRLSIAIGMTVNDGLDFAYILHFKHVLGVYLKMLGGIWSNIITRVIILIYDKPTALVRIGGFGVGVDSFFNGFG